MKLYSASYKWQAMRARWRGYSLRQRLGRLLQHFKNFRRYTGVDKSASAFFGQPIAYLLDFLFYVLDVFAVGEIYETFAEWLKYPTRALNDKERRIVNTIFGSSIDADRIRIDELSITARFSKATYVGVYTINCFGRMSEDLFVHELIHIWQYTTLGSVYIPRALRAQASKEGYNYGGVSQLEIGGAEWMSYNYEQQGDILADYWRAKNGRSTRWNRGLVAVDAFLPFIDQLGGEDSYKV